MGSRMGSFPWKFIEYKEQNGFVFDNFAVLAAGGAGWIRGEARNGTTFGLSRGVIPKIDNHP